MSSEVTSLFAPFTLWWTLIFIGYVLVLAGADALLGAWRRRRADRRRQRDAQRRIAAEQSATVQRIGIAFAAAQQLIRDNASAGRGDRR
jgi:type VI protein secretion system component VasK